MKPTLSPLEALVRGREEGDFELEGFKYILDGSMGCPSEDLFPTAETEDEDGCWYPDHEEGTVIDESTNWFFFKYL